MNTFSNSLFTFFFGWARRLIESVWNAAAEGRLGGFFTWLGDHWLILALILVLGGTALDFLIWLIRWRPYLVWRSTLRRLGRRLRGEHVDSQRRFAKGYSDGVDLGAPVTPPEPEAAPQAAAPAYYPPLMDEFSAPRQPQETPALREDISMPEEGEIRRRRRSERHETPRRIEAFPRAETPRKPLWRPRFPSLEDRDEEQMLDGLPPAVDRQQAFHDPVYPTAPPSPFQNRQDMNQETRV